MILVFEVSHKFPNVYLGKFPEVSPKFPKWGKWHRNVMNERRKVGERNDPRSSFFNFLKTVSHTFYYRGKWESGKVPLFSLQEHKESGKLPPKKYPILE
jgi:hypothetical protein